MRTIKFRAWHKKAKEMLYPDKQFYLFQWIEEGQPIEVMQFTGLLDKNGKDIYEGDIIKRIDTEDTELVIWNRDCFLSRTIYDDWLKRNILDRKKDCSLFLMTTFKIEIIGNMHDNPELLKQ
jgi:uncharacterized phage protein (TIGR01671 family)